MNKAEIRKQETIRRMALNAEQLRQLSEKLCFQFSRIDFSGVRVLHIFLPIAEKKEPDTLMLISWLQTFHPDIHILVPKADFKNLLMTHHPYRGAEGLQKSIFNIPEPAGEEAYTGNIDMVIVPLLAFDRKGYRVGYGKGFYDRFLEEHKTIKIGLSLFGSVDTITDIHANDVRLDACITPEQIIYF